MLPIPRSDILEQTLHEEIVLVNLRTNQIYALNETGARLWQLLREGGSRQQIEKALLAEFAITAEELTVEIDQLIAELIQRDLVRQA